MDGLEMNFRKIYHKPTLFCLTVHQSTWEALEDITEGVMNCSYCKRFFYYPTKALLEPVYKNLTSGKGT